MACLFVAHAIRATMMKNTLLGAKNILRIRRMKSQSQSQRPKSKHKQPKVAESMAKAAESKVTKAGEYTAKDLLVLAQAYTRTSENSIKGTAQKQNNFWDDVAEAFKVLKKHQEEDYDKCVQKNKKYNKIMLRGEFLSSNSEDEVEIIVPACTASSLQQKWSKFVMPYVTKLIVLTTRHPKLSCEGKSSCFFSCFSICCYLTSMFLIFRQ